MKQAKPDYPVAVSSTLHTRAARWARSGRHDCREYGLNHCGFARCDGSKSKGSAPNAHGIPARRESWAFELEMAHRAMVIELDREHRAWLREKAGLGFAT